MSKRITHDASIPEEDLALISAIIARLVTGLVPKLNEFETYTVIQEFMLGQDLSLESVPDLVSQLEHLLVVPPTTELH
jgi:hypothetical protein